MTARLVCLPGDGIGPEVLNAALRVLEAVSYHFNLDVVTEHAEIGGAAIDACGTPLPNKTAALCEQADAILLGAVGGPKWNALKAEKRPERGLLDLRYRLNLFGNLRPIHPVPGTTQSSPIQPEILDGVDMLIVRELSSGIYFGERVYQPTFAYDTAAYTADEISRVVRLAARFAQQRHCSLTLVDKANVLATSRLWRNVATRIMKAEFPEVALDCMLVDAAAMQIISNPSRFDVIVTDNLFGDILSDSAAVLTGSLGLLPSASLSEAKAALYEPVHGSAPDLAGRQCANPVGMIRSVALMLRYSLNAPDAASSLEEAVNSVLRDGPRTPDLAGKGESVTTTDELADHIINQFRSKKDVRTPAHAPGTDTQ